MNEKDRRKRARLMLNAERYRRKYERDDQPFSPLEHIEFELDRRQDVTVKRRFEIFDDGAVVPARVCFSKSGEMRLELSESVEREAACGLPSARFALCHEIAHINLHRTHMIRNKIEGATRNFTYDEKSLHCETAAMENEAHIYGGLLLIPLAEIGSASDFMELARRYNAPPLRARQLRWDVMEIWSTLIKIRSERK